MRFDCETRNASGPSDSKLGIGWIRGRTVSLGIVFYAFLLVLPFNHRASANTLEYPEVELADVIEVDRVGHELFGYDLLGAETVGLRLEVGEEVRWMRSSGRVGLVITDRRLLALTNENEIWQEIRLRAQESRPERGWLGKRVALVVTDQRLLGYESRSGVWLELDVSPNEHIRDVRIGAQTGLVLTDRKAYGLSPGVGSFISTPISIQERIEGLRVGTNIVQISTSRRVLIFRSPIGAWTQSRRTMH